MRQKRVCAGKRTNLGDLAGVGVSVKPLKACSLLRRYSAAGLPQESVHEQASAHPDSPVDPPDRELDSDLLEGFPPREDVLVDAVHQRPAKVPRRTHLAVIASESC